MVYFPLIGKERKGGSTRKIFVGTVITVLSIDNTERLVAQTHAVMYQEDSFCR